MTECPDCDTIIARVSHTEWIGCYVERTLECRDCGTIVTIRQEVSEPEVVDVYRYE